VEALMKKLQIATRQKDDAEEIGKRLSAENAYVSHTFM